MWLCLKRFPPLWLHRRFLNSSCVLTVLIHIKHKYKKMMKYWTDPTSSLAEAINTKIITKHYPDSSHFNSHSPHSHPDSPHSHPNSPHSHPDSPHSQHSHPHSPHSHHNSLHSHLDSTRSHHHSSRSHYSPHSVPRFPIATFTDSTLAFIFWLQEIKQLLESDICFLRFTYFNEL